MRRSVVTAMSLATVAVFGLSLRSSAQPAASPLPEPSVAVTHPGSVKARTARPARKKPTGRTTPTQSPSPTRSPSPTATVTVNGDLVNTDYGPVRVQLTMQGGRIIRAEAVDHPQGGGRTQEINDYAIPVLDQEAVAAQSSQIDTVSGATFTSGGYRQSLQSALDAAHKAGS
jgi:uncharacterized protein with FMN-binding domain